MEIVSTPPSGPSRRQRAASMILVAVLHLALLLALLQLAHPVLPIRPMGSNLTVVTLTEPAREEKRAARAASQSQERAQAEPPRFRRRASEITTAEADRIWSQVMHLSKDEVASVDKVMREQHAVQSADAGTDGIAAGATDASDGPGAGPHGETLYNARWYREPTNAELDTYLPPGARRSGWGMIACRTVARFHVEDCVEIGQSPGSGMAGAVRQAAWQFLVMPPRINGRPMVGEWVRIRIDYIVTKPKERGGDEEPGR